MKTKNKGQEDKENSMEKNLQNNQQINESVSAQKDGFRYDYNDSSDFKNDQMS